MTCAKFFSARLIVAFAFLIFLAHAFCTHFFLLGAYTNEQMTSTKINRNAFFKSIHTNRINKHHHSHQHGKNGVLKHTFLEQQPWKYCSNQCVVSAQGVFFCGKSFSGLPEDNVTSVSVPTLAATLKSF